MKKIVLLFALSIILAGCSGENAADKMYEHLEKSVELEQPFADQQEPFMKLEEEDQTIYNELIELSSDEMDQIKTLQEEALTNIDKRREMLATEKESIEAAEKEFGNISEYVPELKEEVAAKAEEMTKVMEERFSTYYKLNEAYQNSLNEDVKLYELFVKEELTEEELTEQINTVNKLYEEVLDLNNQFNELTDSYNTLKEDFYKAADLNVVFED